MPILEAGIVVPLIRNSALVGSDVRIGSRFLRAGPAYGGSCFPKDTKGLVSIADKYKVDLSIVKSVIKSNQKRKILLTKRVNKILSNKIKNKKIAILGVTFKANTDDMRESSSLVLISYLLAIGLPGGLNILSKSD